MKSKTRGQNFICNLNLRVVFFMVILFLSVPSSSVFAQQVEGYKKNIIIIDCENEGFDCKYYTLDGVFRNERKCKVNALGDGQSSMTCYEYGKNSNLIKVVFVLVYKNIVGRTVRETFENGSLISRETYRDQRKVLTNLRNGIIIDEEIYEKSKPSFLKEIGNVFKKNKKQKKPSKIKKRLKDL